MTWAASILSILMVGMITALCVVAARAVAVHIGALDRPATERHKGHRGAIPLLGGTAIAAGVLVCLGIAAAANAPVLTSIDGGTGRLVVLFLSATLALIVGLIDDLRPTGGLGPRVKLSGQAFAAVVVTVSLGAPTISGIPVIDAGLAIAAVVLLTNAFNLLDNMNGVCAGCAAMLALGVFVSATMLVSPVPQFAGILLAGSLLGFLPFNYPKARIFLGDAGSHFIGHSLAALVIFCPPGRPSPATHLAYAALIFAIPLTDVVWVVVKRLREGRPVMVGDREHLSHRIARSGRGEAVAAVILWLATAATALLASDLPRRGANMALIPAMLASLVILRIWFMARSAGDE